MDEKQFFDKARQVAKAIDRGTYMKEADEYKVCSLEEAEAFAKKRRKDLREMNTGLFDDIQINNPDRDKAWEAFIKRKDVAGWAVDKEGFPLNGFYDVWCIAWSKAQEKCRTPIKELSDEEIIEIAKEHIHQKLEGERFGYVDFARAILKKASEK